MKGWVSVYQQVSLVQVVQVGLCFVKFVKMCILLSAINPSLSLISCTGDVEEIQNKVTARFTTRQIMAIDWELVCRGGW
jgi:hypothetical protein